LKGDFAKALTNNKFAGDAALQAEAEMAKAELKIISRPASAVRHLRADSVLRASITAARFYRGGVFESACTHYTQLWS